MHRSGTTMIAKMLREMGLFIGWDLEPNYESKFFLTINQAILNAYSGNWDNPDPVENLLNHSDLRAVITQNLINDLNSFRAFYFLGPRRYMKNRSIQALNFRWGWKDPRNTFLLPIWLDIFPEAKIIHIYRNGIDVAGSLMNREHRRIKSITNKVHFSKIASSQKKQIIDDGLILYLFNKIQTRYRKLNPFQKYRKMGISQCASVEKGFELWCDYMKKALEYMKTDQNELLNIRYEDFLVDPEHHLKQILSFCGLPDTEKKLKSMIANVNPKRRFAFKNDKSLYEFYESVKDHPLMARFGYQKEVIDK